MTTPAYDTDNIFAKILRGELPAHKVYEDDMTIAIMDIMPRADGHTLVIPKNASRNLLDVKAEDINAVMATAQKIARAQMTAFEADGITVQQFNESAGGQVIFHLHVHVIPRKEGVPLKPHTGEMADGELLSGFADQLRKALEAA
ncbi:HIT family protein [Cohaesibacter sp. CAU 1516]|uniref:HIT family protein n=1 Tax=Cohaesibacter sp. CAU 1516 TaxID=2576038 RepID=UPI0010FED056|nr:HIT family protein [Cohaesibacter sp. CAU 1516]TLP48839.1 HIT family protein [Cohaesibacter sp. CAU 1516]